MVAYAYARVITPVPKIHPGTGSCASRSGIQISAGADMW
jgi:hypothetical protein